MVHLKKTVSGEFYWLSVGKKANTFEENAKSSESFKIRGSAMKSIKVEASIFGDYPNLTVIDYTGKSNKIKAHSLLNDGKFSNIPFESLSKHQRAEVSWEIERINGTKK